LLLKKLERSKNPMIDEEDEIETEIVIEIKKCE